MLFEQGYDSEFRDKGRGGPPVATVGRRWSTGVQGKGSGVLAALVRGPKIGGMECLNF